MIEKVNGVQCVTIDGVSYNATHILKAGKDEFIKCYPKLEHAEKVYDAIKNAIEKDK
jgi:hypothetical protein